MQRTFSHDCCRAGLLLAVLFVPALRPACGDEGAEQPPLRSGREAGEYVPTFYVRAVNGPLMNKSVCFVCRNGSRPVVMVLLRRVDPELKPLLKNVDRLVDRYRDRGLRAFAVMVAEEPFGAISAAQTFCFEHQIDLPISVAGEAVAAPSCQNVHGDAAVTVVLYEKRRVLARYAFRRGELSRDQAREVLLAVRGLVEEPVDASASSDALTEAGSLDPAIARRPNGFSEAD